MVKSWPWEATWQIKKLLSCLADFGCYEGWRVGVNLLKKVKVCDKNLFSDSVDVKTDRNKKTGSCIFL